MLEEIVQISSIEKRKKWIS